ncbi:MAG: SBBP repeat-containing protein [Bacteroidetes bacterium]|nr:SBBP repeat-containing protein [Bacteroidota bacterium]MBS1629814.1 SBBP repeat-containing protein [Bacteroidota bacterium]
MENKGQVRELVPMPKVLYHLSTPGMNISLTANGICYTFLAPVRNGNTDGRDCRAEGLSLTLVGANPQPRISTGEPSAYREYFVQGSRQLETQGYGRIVYHEVYPNIDWVVYVSQHNGGEAIEHDFIVRPGGNPADIQLKYTGAQKLRLNDNGSLSTMVHTGTLVESEPIAYMQEDKAKMVRVRYRLQETMLGYEVNKPRRGTLVIDPQVVWVTYYGGFSTTAKAVACDTSGNAYMAGATGSIAQIAVPGGYDTTYGGGSSDAFLAVFARNGIPIWTTYFGGGATDDGTCVALDRFGNAYLCGATMSSGLITTTSAYQANLGGSIDGFIAKFSSTGGLCWATYYGGSNRDLIHDAACDSAGNLYVGGITMSTSGIATAGSFRSIMALNNEDAFAAKFDSAGTRIWGTYFGGTKDDIILAVRPDNKGHVFIAGATQSGDSIATPGAFRSSNQVSLGANQVAPFLAQLDATNGTRIWATYYGTASSMMDASALACDNAGNVYFAGHTTDSSSGFTTAGSSQPSYGGISDNYLVKFDGNGNRIWATYYGGSDNEGGGAISNSFSSGLDKVGLCLSRNRLWLCGFTKSTNNIATAGSYQDSAMSSPFLGDDDAYMALFDTSGKRTWASYIASTGVEAADGIACNAKGDVYVCGRGVAPASGNGIATPGAYQSSGGGAFLAYLIDSTSKLYIQDISPQCEGGSFMSQFFVTANGVLRGSNVFKAEMADAAGWFTAPVVLGTLSSLSSGFIPCTLPSGVSGTRRVRVVSTLPHMVSDTTTVAISPLPHPPISQSGNRLSVASSFQSYQWYRNGNPIPGATSYSITADSNGSYSVEVTSSMGCKGTSPDYNFSVNVGSFAGDRLQVFPNPTNDLVFIMGAPKGGRAILSDMSGRKLASYILTGNRQAVSLVPFSPGIYQFGLFDTQGNEQTIKIEKK